MCANVVERVNVDVAYCEVRIDHVPKSRRQLEEEALMLIYLLSPVSVKLWLFRAENRKMFAGPSTCVERESCLRHSRFKDGVRLCKIAFRFEDSKTSLHPAFQVECGICLR